MRMKDKKAEQAAARDRHKAQLKDRRRAEPTLERAEPALHEKPTILIVCEGGNTEPSYFRQFRLSTAVIKSVGTGYNTVSLVTRAIQLATGHTYDQVWCVFDKDDFSANDFNNAIAMAEAQGFGVAYSNQAFEYWLILHFDDHQGGSMHRSSYGRKLNRLLRPHNISYRNEEDKLIDEVFFELLDGTDEQTGKERKRLAIERAKKNYNHRDHHNPAIEESSTTVFRLVEELLKYV